MERIQERRPEKISQNGCCIARCVRVEQVPMTGNQLLTTGKIAARFGVHPSTVHRWVQQGLLHPATEAGGYRLFAESEVDRFAAGREAVKS